MGQRNQAMFGVVVSEKANAVKGKFMETVGSYAVSQKPKIFTFDKERILYWISKGAIPSDTVASLLKREGVAGMEKYIKGRTKTATKKKAGAES